MQAAAHPAKVDYLYFVRKPDRMHHFFTASDAAFQATRTPTASGDHSDARGSSPCSGIPVAESLSPRMQNAAFAARGLDWAYVACDVRPERSRRRARARSARVRRRQRDDAAQAGRRRAAPRPSATSVNTLVFRDGRIVGHSTDAAVLAGLERRAPA